MTAGTRTRLWAPLAVLTAAVAAVAIGGGLAAPSPAAAAPAAAQVGRFVWHDLVTRDAAACRAFYGALLGWEFSQTTREGHPYFLARSGGAFVGGIVPLEAPGPGPAAWLGYLSVPDLDQAVAEYRRLTAVDPNTQVRYLIHPLYHYRLGRVYEEKGEKSDAASEYKKFLEYWKDADASHPELGDARKRLEALDPAR